MTSLTLVNPYLFLPIDRASPVSLFRFHNELESISFPIGSVLGKPQPNNTQTGQPGRLHVRVSISVLQSSALKKFNKIG